jgi:hypothetical protein
MVRGEENIGLKGVVTPYRVIDRRLGKIVCGRGFSLKLAFISKCNMAGDRINSRTSAPCGIFGSRLPVIMNLLSLGKGGKENVTTSSELGR